MKRTAVLLLALFLAGCDGRGEGPGGDGEGRAATPVEVHVVELGRAVLEVSATGTVAARRDIALSAEAAGQVLETPAKVGDKVSEGDVLVRLDPELAELALDQAEAQLLLAEADLDRAESALRRATELWKEGDLSDSDYEATLAAAKASRASHMAARAARAQASRQLRNTEIESPVDGVVAFVHVDEGQLVGLGTPVAHVVNDDIVEVEIGLNEDQMAGLRPGARATVSVRAHPNETFQGRIEYVGPKADELSRTYPVRVVVPNSGRRLRSGMVAEVTLAAQEFEDVVTLERDWIVQRFGEPAVFVVSDSVAALRKVALGRIVGDKVIVRSGLEPGDRVVSFGYDQLSEGAPIDVRNDGGSEATVPATGGASVDTLEDAAASTVVPPPE